MTIDDLKQLLELVREHDLVEFELEQEGTRVRLRKDAPAPFVAPPPGAHAWTAPAGPVTVAGPAVSPTLSPAAADPGGAPDVDLELAVVTSPMVGTFYRAPAPGSPAFVEVGTTVKQGQVLCIIEAMKLMNEIESEYAGEVVKVFVDNGQPVQYGERLFAIKAK